MINPELASTGISQAVSEWVVRVMEALGAPGAGLLIALENLFPPLPSELILPSAGFAASRGDMNLLAVIICTTLGSVIGAIILYYVGALLGRERTRAIARKLPLVSVEDIDKTENWFVKHETKTVFWGRMIPVFRSLISIPAGVERMPMRTFVTLTFFGSLIWNTALIMAGYTLGENWSAVERYVGVFQKVVIAAVVIAVVYFVVKRIRRKKAA